MEFEVLTYSFLFVYGSSFPFCLRQKAALQFHGYCHTEAGRRPLLNCRAAADSNRTNAKSPRVWFGLLSPPHIMQVWVSRWGTTTPAPHPWRQLPQAVPVVPLQAKGTTILPSRLLPHLLQDDRSRIAERQSTQARPAWRGHTVGDEG